MEQNTDILAQLQALKGLTKTTGLLYEPQVLQIKMWGNLFFDPQTVKIAVDISNNIIQYTVKPADFANNYTSLNTHPFAEFAKTVKLFFGDEWVVEIVKGSKSLGFLPTEFKEEKNGPSTKRRGNRRSPGKPDKKRKRSSR